MDSVVKKTGELSDAEIESINTLFFEVFGLQRDILTVREECFNAPLGYSVHSLMYDKGLLVAYYVYMPFYYKKKVEKFIAALGFDSMVQKEYREFFTFYETERACWPCLRGIGCKLLFGFPNDESYPVMIKGFKVKDIGRLTTYILPIKIGPIIPRMRWLDPFFRLFSWSLIKMSHLSKGKKIRSFVFEKDRESFDKVRYRWNKGQYEIRDIKGCKYVYRIEDHKDRHQNFNPVKTAFLLDVYPMNRSNFEFAVRSIYQERSKDIDLIMYVGDLDFVPVSLIKIPHRFEPKHFHFTCNLIDKSYFDDTLYDIKNWDVNLSSYDLV